MLRCSKQNNETGVPPEEPHLTETKGVLHDPVNPGWKQGAPGRSLKWAVGGMWPDGLARRGLAEARIRPLSGLITEFIQVCIDLVVMISCKTADKV